MRRLVVALLLLAVAVGPAAAPGLHARPSHNCAFGKKPKPRELRFGAADGTKLAGHRYGTGRTAVVLAHQSDGDLCQWDSYARRLDALGYLAIAFDFRNRGLSQRRTGTPSFRLASDVSGAARLARRLGARKVFLVGASIGGAAAVVAGSTIQPAVNGVVALSSPASTAGLDPLAGAKRLTVPVLYLAGKNDVGLPEDAQDLYAATASTDKAIETLPVGEHGFELVKYWPRARQLVEAFLRSH